LSIIFFYRSTAAVKGVHQTFSSVYVIHQFPEQFEGQIQHRLNCIVMADHSVGDSGFQVTSILI
jgi:hypothetical protein